MIRALLCCALFVCAPAHAQTPYQRPAGAADPYEPLIVAGYRALFTCSAYFFAGRPLADIERVELVDVAHLKYPAPVIDTSRRQVTASDPAGQTTQTAVYRDGMGCTVLPPHWTKQDAAKLPAVPLPTAPDLSRVAFPAGDRIELPASGIAPGHDNLAALLPRAFDGASYGSAPGVVTTAVIVLRGGRLVAERYRQGFGVHSGYRTWSTAKSITAALMAIAESRGIVDLTARADVPAWQSPGDPRRDITYRHLLWMSSGLTSGGSNTNAIYFGGQDIVSAATGTALEAAPGTRWKYANNDTLLLLHALRTRMNDDARYWRFPYDALLHRIGMFHTRLEVDHLGNFVGSSQTYTTARDLARFGLLLARDGVWDGQRILPEGWLRFATTPAPAKPVTPGQWGYGAQFWLLDQMPGVPPGTFTTAGNKGQYVTVVPGKDLVIVRTGIDPEGRRWEADRFVADVVKALD